MLSSVLILANSNTEKESLLLFDFEKLNVSFVIEGNIVFGEKFDDWDQLLAAFKWFMCKEDWIFYEV